MTQSLLNTPTPEFRGAANSLYGDRGPTRSYGNPGRRREGPPQSIADHMKLCRDISFIRMIAEQARGPYSEAAVQDEDRPL